MIADTTILKAVLMLRRLGNKTSTKEEQIAEQKRWIAAGFYDDPRAMSFGEWIDSMREELTKTPEELDREARERREWEDTCACLERVDGWRERDEWDDLWADRARECGAVCM